MSSPTSEPVVSESTHTVTRCSTSGASVFTQTTGRPRSAAFFRSGARVTGWCGTMINPWRSSSRASASASSSPSPSPGIGAMNDSHVAGLDRTHRVLDALAHEVEERRDLAGKVDADPELLLGNEEARGQVRSIAERLGPLQDPAARLLVDPGAVVERAVDGPDREAKALGNLADPRRLVGPASSSWPGHPHSSRLPAARARASRQALDGPRGVTKSLTVRWPV